MAEAVATSDDLQVSRELARAKLATLKSGRRGRAGSEYYGANESTLRQDLGRDTVNDAGAGRTVPESIEKNDRLAQFRQNVGARAARYGQLRALRAAQRGQISSQAVEANAAQAASAFARQAYARVWQLAEEGVQDFALSFFDLMLISGPTAIAMFVLRLIGGNMMGGAGTINFRGAAVPRIPGYTSILEGVYKFGKIFLIGLFSGLIYTIIIFLVILIAHPEVLAELALCSIFGGALQFLGFTVCSAT